MQRDTGRPYTRSRAAHCISTAPADEIEERPEASYAASYFGGDPEDYDVIKVDAGYMGAFDIEATDGTRTLEAAVGSSTAGFGTNEAYHRARV